MNGTILNSHPLNKMAREMLMKLPRRTISPTRGETYYEIAERGEGQMMILHLIEWAIETSPRPMWMKHLDMMYPLIHLTQDLAEMTEEQVLKAMMDHIREEEVKEIRTPLNGARILMQAMTDHLSETMMNPKEELHDPFQSQ
jgi:hypothetical protein